MDADSLLEALLTFMHRNTYEPTSKYLVGRRRRRAVPDRPDSALQQCTKR